jgi:16S rRNA (guanine966-N2)-methyltransferase
MSPIRIIAGELKGRVIPFSNKQYDNADITPQKVKGAIFSIIGERLDGEGFIDLFSGSGQIGLEALSRGSDPVIFNEPDGKRYLFIKSFIEKLHLSRRPIILNMEYQDSLVFLHRRGITVHYVFLDPPYSKMQKTVPEYRQIIEKITQSRVIHGKGKIILQHFSGNILDEEIGRFHLTTTKKYGKTSLAVYV